MKCMYKFIIDKVEINIKKHFVRGFNWQQHPAITSILSIIRNRRILTVPSLLTSAVSNKESISCLVKFSPPLVSAWVSSDLLSWKENYIKNNL